MTAPQSLPVRVRAAAREALDAGCNVLPIRSDGSKAPATTAWARWQTERQTREAAGGLFPPDSAAEGFAIVCGEGSGGLECLDFDEPGVLQRFATAADAAGMGDLLARIVDGYHEQTPNGEHVLWRCETVAGNAKLAQRIKAPDERANEHDKLKALIETRGAGGYFIAAPSGGGVHPTGRSYTLLSGGFASIARITPEEREALLKLAGTLDGVPKRDAEATPKEAARGLTGGSASIADAYNARTTWAEILEPHGWTLHHTDSTGEAYWTRPGKGVGEGISATTNYAGSDRLVVFTTSSPFQAYGETGHGYSRFAAYAVLEHGGDHSEAARALGERDRMRAKAGAAASSTSESRAEMRGASALEDGTDDGMAERLVRLHGEDLLRVPIWKRWFVWDGRRYRIDHDEADARAKMRATVRSIFHEAAKADGEDAKRLGTMAIKGRSKPGMAHALWIAQSDARVIAQPSDLDADPWAFNVSNGTLDLRTGRLRLHRKADRFTRCGPVAYDPEAKAPRWLAFLERVLPDPEVRRYLQQSVGYSLTGSTVAECLWILSGGGANGKSTFLETVRAAFGSDYAAELDANALTVRKGGGDEMELTLAPLDGRRLGTTLELSEGQRLHEQAVKRLTSGEPMRARHRYSDSYEFVPRAKLWMGTNHRPSVAGDDDGIWRRLRLVPFEVQIPEAERDPDLREKLRAELPGVLAWAVAGCLDWQRHGFVVPEVVRNATSDYRSAEDVIGGFLDECCDEGRALWCAFADLTAALQMWVKANGETMPTSTALGSRLTRRGFASKKAGGKRGREGLQLREKVREAVQNHSRSAWSDS